MPRLRPKRTPTKTGNGVTEVLEVEAIETIRLGHTGRFIPAKTRFPITADVVRQAPHLFQHPARAVTPEEVNDGQ